MSPTILNLRTLARHVLEHSHAFNWSLQGLGMLRLHMSNETRLHIWDRRFAFPGASPIHDHLQWALHSTILSGQLTNIRFIEVSGDALGEPFMYQTVVAGYNFKPKHEPREIRLCARAPEVYTPGDTYSQEPNEIHQTIPVDGTVTIMRKSPTDDRESARIFWPVGEQWGTAQPRAATRHEVHEIARLALAKWKRLEGEQP